MFWFLGVALLILAIVPMINIKLLYEEKNIPQRWWARSVLYNFDFALSSVSSFFYPLGISLFPTLVVIGEQDWLFLGDYYEQALSNVRNSPTQLDIAQAQEIATATDAWDKWLKEKGVRGYQIMLAANKDSVYPEFLPKWVKPATYDRTDALLALANIDQEIYFDSRPALLDAKYQFEEPFFFKTDTHWNQLGGWIAFHNFMKNFARSETQLQVLSEKLIRISSKESTGGDLANFLRMQADLKDIQIVFDIEGDFPKEARPYEFEGVEQIDALHRPIITHSKNALNNKKVLWLRDSFGVPLAPFMEATFTETVELYYAMITPTNFARLVEIYNPDYVFITIVERSAYADWFKHLPPQ